MKKTGQLLRETRESKGISLQEVSVHLKINSRILRALEEGDQNQLPAKTFLRGFVQSYAQFLRLDGDEVLELFQAEMGTTHPKMITKLVEMAEEAPRTQVSVNPQTISPQSVSSTENKVIGTQTPVPPSLSVDHKTWSHSMKIGTALVILFICGVIFVVIKTIEKYEREAIVVESPMPGIQVVPRSEEKPLNSPISSIIPTPSHDALQALAPTSQPAPTPVETTGINTEIPNTLETQTPVPTPNTVGEQALETSKPQIEERPQEVIVEALDRVIIDYSIDDRPRATLVLSPEKVHTFRGDRKLSLGFSDGGSINLIYNGKDKGVPGNLGKPLKMEFPE